MSERVQKMARINVDPQAWAELRVRALRRNSSLADVLGDLIESEAGAAEHVSGARPATRATRHPRLGGGAASAAAPQRKSSAPPEVQDWDAWVPPRKE